MNDKYVIQLQGKEYKLVAGRVIDFRRAHPNGAITTELLLAQDDLYVFKATIVDGDGRVLATAHGSCTKASVRPPVTPMEKAETKAIGRALGLAGYGTDDINDDADGENLADSPIPTASAQPIESMATLADSAPFNAVLTTLSKYTSKAGKAGIKATWRDEADAVGECLIFGRRASDFGVPDDMRDAMLAGATITAADAPLVELQKSGRYVNLVRVFSSGTGWRVESEAKS